MESHRDSGLECVWQVEIFEIRHFLPVRISLRSVFQRFQGFRDLRFSVYGLRSRLARIIIIASFSSR